MLIGARERWGRPADAVDILDRRARTRFAFGIRPCPLVARCRQRS
jgi:hypothetical protein